MKKVTLLFIAIFIECALYSQEMPAGAADVRETPFNNTTIKFSGFEVSAFRQVSQVYVNAWFCDNSYTWDYAADDYSASRPFFKLRFWGGIFYSCTPGTSQTFLINFYDGNPCNGGNLVHSFTKTATITPLGNYSWGSELFQADVDFGQAIGLLNGWVRITRINPGDGCLFGWLAFNQTGGNSVQYNASGYYCETRNTGFYFCLGNDPIQAIPVSNWALVLGIGLIALFVVLRFRKLSVA